MPLFSAPVDSFVGCLFPFFAAGRAGGALVVVDGKRISDPSRISFLDLGLGGGEVFEVTVLDTCGCLGGVEGEALTRRTSLPRRAKNARTPTLGALPDPPLAPAVPTPTGRAAPPFIAPDICEADFVGATASIHHAQGLLGTKVEMVFEHCPYLGTVVNFEVFPAFGDRILHIVQFDDGMSMDCSFHEVLAGAEAFVRARAASGTSVPVIVLPGVTQQPAQAPPVPPPAPLTPAQTVSLGVPASFSAYPFRLLIDEKWAEGRIVDREVTPSGVHRWCLRLLAPRQDEVIWLERQELAKHLEYHRLSLKLSAPARKIPSLTPVRGLVQPVGGGWSTTHPLVNLQVVVYLTTTTETARLQRAAMVSSGRKGRGATRPTHTVLIEAVRDHGSLECWGRIQDDLESSVLFLGASAITEGAFGIDLPSRFNLRGRGHAKRSPALGLRTPPAGPEGLPDTSFNNSRFSEQLRSLPPEFSSDASSFFKDGIRVAPNKVPRSVMALYRRGLNFVLENLLKEKDPELVEALWRLFLVYDGLILAPFQKGAQFVSVIKERVALFLAGDWDKLFQKQLQFRDPSKRPQEASPLHHDPRDAKAHRAQLNLQLNQSLTGAAAALRANANPVPPKVGDVTEAFQKLNPQAGEEVPRPVEARTSIGPQTLAEHVASAEFLRGLGLDPSRSDDPTWARRPLRPPAGPLPAPLTFSVEEVMKRVRRTNKASAGGLSGSNYKSMQAWFHDADPLAEKLTAVFNRIAAGQVPAKVIPLLAAGRGVAIPKPEGVGLRPVVVGNIILRFVGTLALVQQSAKITKFFLEPKPLQFAVGLAGGCELMVSAVSALLDEHPDWVDLAADAQNAFNSFCRSKMWGPLLEHFPNMAALARLMYGSASSIIFHEDGVGRTEVLNSVGSRQGCSWGSFLYCLTIQPLLRQLAEEFPGCRVLAFADDVHILGPAEVVAVAYERWRFLYAAILQGVLKDSKSKCYSPNLSAAAVRAAGLPPAIAVTTVGTRVLGGPVGSLDFCRSFAEGIVAEVEEDFEIIGRMSSLQAQLCLTTGSVQHRINHLLRTIAGGELSEFGDVMARYDDALLRLPRRIARRLQLPNHAVGLVGLSLASGGLGFRTWKSTADCAYLASYMHTSSHFPRLFPDLAHRFPPILALVPASGAAHPPPSAQAALAARAFVRITSNAPLVRDRLEGSATVLKHTQHVLSTIVDEAEARRVVGLISGMDNPRLPRHMELYHSNCGDATTLATLPFDPATTLSNRSFETGIVRRLLLPITPVTRGERRQCPTCHKASTRDNSSDEPGRSVDEFGDHNVGCKRMLSLRTRLWHDPLVQTWHSLARMVGLSCGSEVYNLMVNSGKRPDVAIFKDLYNIITDVRTIAGADSRYCPTAALVPGHGAAWGAIQKDDAWLQLAHSQGDTFIPLCHESGGRLGAQAIKFLDELSVTAGGSQGDRVAFKTYALQRLHAATFRGVALLINSRPVLRSGPEVPPERGALPLPPPPLRAVINFSSHLCFPHGDSTNTFITTPRTTPAT